MKIIDSHCHLQYPKYENDREEVILKTLDASIQMICVGTDFQTSNAGIEIAQKYEGVWASVGLHPNDNLNENFDSSEYEKLLKMPKVVAMGEIGLDYYRTVELEAQKIQKNRFEIQLDLAVRTNMPVILHSRDSGKGSTGLVHPDMISILKNNLPPKLGVAHSFTGTIEEAKTYLDLGFYLGFNGIITFARQYDEVVKYVPLEGILLETDAPFLAPEPYRGQRNEPSYIIEVAKILAELKGESIEKIAQQTTENSKRLFNI